MFYYFILIVHKLNFPLGWIFQCPSNLNQEVLVKLKKISAVKQHCNHEGWSELNVSYQVSQIMPVIEVISFSFTGFFLGHPVFLLWII